MPAGSALETTTDDPERDAEEVCAGLEKTMEALIAVVEEETALVRSGDLSAAGEVERRKSQYARRYLEWLDVFQAIGPTLRELAPVGVDRVRRQHEVFRATLQISLTVLATARDSLMPPEMAAAE